MSTVRIFKSKWSQLLLEFVGVIGVGVALVLWKGEAITWFLVIFLVGYLAYRLFMTGAVVKTVTLRCDGVDIEPLLPWFKPRRWHSDELGTYKSVALTGRLKSQPFMGILTPKEGKHEIIWASGTDEFAALDELLSRLLPPPVEQERVEHERMIQS